VYYETLCSHWQSIYVKCVWVNVVMWILCLEMMDGKDCPFIILHCCRFEKNCEGLAENLFCSGYEDTLKCIHFEIWVCNLKFLVVLQSWIRQAHVSHVCGWADRYFEHDTFCGLETVMEIWSLLVRKSSYNRLLCLMIVLCWTKMVVPHFFNFVRKVVIMVYCVPVSAFSSTFVDTCSWVLMWMSCL
jgi:hypothetical protein